MSTQNDIIQKVAQVTIEDVKRTRGFGLSERELSSYWLRYPEEVPEVARKSIGNMVYKETKAKTYWINGNEVKIYLY